MSDQALRVAAATVNPKPGDVAANQAAILNSLELAAAEGARLVVFPEGILSGYDLELKEQSALRMGDEALEVIARRAESLDLVASVGFLERTDEGYYVSQAFLGKDVRLVYRKCHRTGWEQEHCLAGEALTVQELGAVTTGTLICYDSAFPRASESLVKRGAQLLLTPTSNGLWLKDLEAQGGAAAVLAARKEHVHGYWRARAFDYSVYALYVEPVGTTEKGEFHCGYAAIFGPDGKCLAEHMSGEAGMITADIYPGRLEAMREAGVGHYRVLRDARVELYE